MPAHFIYLFGGFTFFLCIVDIFPHLQHVTTIGTPLEKTIGKRLTISQPQLSDSGTYTCWARTRLQRDYAEVDLNVFSLGECLWYKKVLLV